VLGNANAASLRDFLIANVEPGSRIITDGWRSYPPATRDLYEHAGTSVASSGLEAHEVLPAVHRVFSLVKRWIMGTMQGSVSPEHVQSYFDEWVFGFNRRHSRSRGLLFYRLMAQAANSDAVTYKDLRKAGRTRPAYGTEMETPYALFRRAIHIDAVDSADHFAVRHGLSSGSTARVPGQERGPGGLCGRSAGRGLATMSR